MTDETDQKGAHPHHAEPGQIVVSAPELVPLFRHLGTLAVVAMGFNRAMAGAPQVGGLLRLYRFSRTVGDFRHTAYLLERRLQDPHFRMSGEGWRQLARLRLHMTALVFDTMRRFLDGCANTGYRPYGLHEACNAALGEVRAWRRELEDNQQEIQELTQPPYRGRGLGELAAQADVVQEELEALRDKFQPLEEFEPPPEPLEAPKPKPRPARKDNRFRALRPVGPEEQAPVPPFDGAWRASGQ